MGTFGGPRFEPDARRTGTSRLKEPVSEEQRSGRPKMGLPFGAGRFWAAPLRSSAIIVSDYALPQPASARSKIGHSQNFHYLRTAQQQKGTEIYRVDQVAA